MMKLFNKLKIINISFKIFIIIKIIMGNVNFVKFRLKHIEKFQLNA